MFYIQAALFNMIVHLVVESLILTYHLVMLVVCSFTVVVCWIWKQIDEALYNYAQKKEREK